MRHHRRRRHRRRGMQLHPVAWILIGAFVVLAYFVVVEKSPPQKLVGLVSDSSGETSSTPTPVTEEGLIARANTANTLYWAVVDGATLVKCTDAIRIMTDAVRRGTEKFGHKPSANNQRVNIRDSIKKYLEETDDIQGAIERIEFYEDLTKRLEKACF